MENLKVKRPIHYWAKYIIFKYRYMTSFEMPKNTMMPFYDLIILFWNITIPKYYLTIIMIDHLLGAGS